MLAYYLGIFKVQLGCQGLFMLAHVLCNMNVQHFKGQTVCFKAYYYSEIKQS